MHGSQLAQILVVSPEPFFGRLAPRILEAAGYTCLVASGSGEALSELRRSEVALVVCEHCPPELDAVAMLVALRRGYPQVARLLVTGDLSPRIFERAKQEADVHYYLTLPIAPENLVEVTRALLTSGRAQRVRTRQVTR